MRLSSAASLLSASALALALSACQTATNAPNSQLATPASTAATVAATPGSVPATNSSLVDFVVPQTFKTFSANSHYEQGLSVTRKTTYELDPIFTVETTRDPLTGLPVSRNVLSGYTRENPNSPVISVSGTRTATLYDGEQPQNLSDKLQITRDPRSATFSVTIASGGVTQNLRWQDPMHRTLFPQDGIPGSSLLDSGLTVSGNLPLTGNAAYDDYLFGRNLVTGASQPEASFNRPGPNPTQVVGDAGVPRGKTNIEYYQSGSETGNGYTVNTLFFERVGQSGAAGTPGTNKYVTWAGVRTTNYTRTYNRTTRINTFNNSNNNDDIEIVTEEQKDEIRVDRSAFVFGMNSLAKDIPKTGTATYTGSLFANYTYTGGPSAQTQFDTIWGTATSKVTFATDAINVTLNGTLQNTGERFLATGSAIIQRPDLPNTALNPTAEQPISRFVGSFSAVSIGNRSLTPNINASLPNTFQASTIEGGFFGPNDTATRQPAELGAAFRIVGGQPDERLDILGAFIGARTGN